MTAHVPSPRNADHTVYAMFLGRHSPRAFTDAALTMEQLLSLLEAARWAPSSNNMQPWRFAYGLRGDDGFARIAEALVPSNRTWADKAAALVVVASKTVVEKDGQNQPNAAHAFDAGSAWMSLALQAHLNGLFAHAMGGFDKVKAAKLLNLPADHELHAVVAIGTQGSPETLPEALRPGELPNDRAALSDLAKHGTF